MSSINAYFRDVLGASLLNSRWSWGGVDHERRRVFLRVWRDDLAGSNEDATVQILDRLQTRSRPGWNERVKHVELLRNGYKGFGVLCDRKDPEASTIIGFDHDSLLVFGDIVESGDAVRVSVRATVRVADLGIQAPSSSSLARDLADIASAPLSETTRLALIEARVGQGRYRRQVLQEWGNACAVTGCAVQAVLRASHCKPWRACDNRERLDANNGLPLVATLDALFDAGLIAFNGDGSMQVSTVLSAAECGALGLPAHLRRRPNPRLSRYLNDHRELVFVTQGASPSA